MEKQFTLRLTEQELNTVFGALQELPYRVARGLVDNIVQQVQAQSQPQAPAEPEVEAE